MEIIYQTIVNIVPRLRFRNDTGNGRGKWPVLVSRAYNNKREGRHNIMYYKVWGANARNAANA